MTYLLFNSVLGELGSVPYPRRSSFCWNQGHISHYKTEAGVGGGHSWTCFPVSYSAHLKIATWFLQIKTILYHLFFPPSPQRSRLLPVIPALSVNVCCSVSTSIKLFLSCSAVTESTAHDCRPRGLAINHRACVRVRLGFWLSVCVCVHMQVLPISFLEVTRRYEAFIFTPLTPEMPMASLSGLLVNEV